MWWWILAAAIAALIGGVVVWLVTRSVRRWPPEPPGTDPVAQQAQARLWSKAGSGSGPG